jgi:hypothetical protein
MPKKEPISRAYNTDATTLNIPLLRADKQAMDAAAAKEAAKRGLKKLPTAQWARMILGKAAGIKLS